MDAAGKETVGCTGRGALMYVRHHVENRASGKLLDDREPNSVLRDDLQGWGGAGGRLRRGGIYLCL